MTIVANYCAVDPNNLGKPMKEKLPPADSYTRDDFYQDIEAAKNKGEIIEALFKTLAKSNYASRMPIEVRNKIIRNS